MMIKMDLLCIFKYIESNQSLNLKLTNKYFKFLSDQVHDPFYGVNKLILENNIDCFQNLIEKGKLKINEELFIKCLGNRHFFGFVVDNSKFSKSFLLSHHYSLECLRIVLEHVRLRCDISHINFDNMILGYFRRGQDECLKLVFKHNKYYSLMNFQDLALASFTNNNFAIFKIIIKYCNLSQLFLYSCFRKSFKEYNREYLLILCKHAKIEMDFSELYTIAFIKYDEDVLKALIKGVRRITKFPYFDSKEFIASIITDIKKVKLAHKFHLIDYMDFNDIITYSNSECFEYIYERYWYYFEIEQLIHCITTNNLLMMKRLLKDKSFDICPNILTENPLYHLYLEYDDEHDSDMFRNMRAQLIGHPKMTFDAITKCAYMFYDKEILKILD